MPVLLLLALLSAQDTHQAGVNARGDQTMGFSHEKTTHHFELRKDGGAIQVAATGPNDAASRDQIRMHLQHIVSMFAAGNFDAPMLIHGRNVPGTATMARLKHQIRYQAHETEQGAEVTMVTDNREALAAIHKFLKFQIKDHQTGDPPRVK